MVKALLALIDEEHLLASSRFDRADSEREGEALAASLSARMPLFYTSSRNEALGYFAKIFSNETAKIPAFSNIIPELNHNEMQGFGGGDAGRALMAPLTAVFLRDASDTDRIRRRMDLTEQVIREAGIQTVPVSLPSGNRAETFLYGFWLIRTAAHALARDTGVDPDETLLIDSFKRML